MSRLSGAGRIAVPIAVLVAVVCAPMAPIGGAVVSAGPMPVALGTSRSFAVLAGAGITNLGPTTITGNVGAAPIAVETGFETVTLHGKNHVADKAAVQAQTALVGAYNDAAGRTAISCTESQLGGTTKYAHTYCVGDTATLDGTLTLDAQGNSDAVFIFRIGTALHTRRHSKVKLVNGARACNVYWVLGTSATLDPDSRFVGTVLARSYITVNARVNVNGRLMSRKGTVNLHQDVVSNGACTTAAARA